MSKNSNPLTNVKLIDISKLSSGDFTDARRIAYRKTNDPIYQSNQALADKVSELVGQSISREMLYYYWENSSAMSDDIRDVLLTLLGPYLLPFIKSGVVTGATS